MARAAATRTASHRREARRVNPTLANDVNAPAQRIRYYSILVDLMSHKNPVESYPPDKTFTAAELLTITPDDVKQWMCFRAYGMDDPGANDNPIHLRSSTLEYYKKAISYFMPNTDAWTVDVADPNGGRGNPTKSPQVNGMLAAVRKKEVKKRGKESKAARPFTKEEFLQVKDMIGTYGVKLNRLRHVAMLALQFHTIGQCNEVVRIKKDSFAASGQFPGYLTVKMPRPKNARDEPPAQLLMGSLNTKYCVLLPMAIFLEEWIKCGVGVSSQWLFCDGATVPTATQKAQDKEADVLKTAYTRAIKFAADSPSFMRSTRAKGDLGSNSIRKLATNVARRSGASKDEADYRARSNIKKMQKRCTDTQLDWPDIKAGSKLCVGGICLYRVKAGVGLLDDYIAQTFAPGITSVFGITVGAVLGKVLLWAALDHNGIAEGMPLDLRETVCSNWIQSPAASGRGNDFNPIERVEVIPSQQDGAVSLDVIPNEDAYPNGGEPGAGGGAPLMHHNAQWRAAIYAKTSAVHSQVTDFQNHVVAELAEMKKRNRRLEEMVRTLVTRPASVLPPGARAPPPHFGAPAAAIAGLDTRPAVLSSCPRSLEVLWAEWQNGCGPNKPARLFDAAERGRSKHKYTRRLVFWRCMIRLLRNGCDVATAIGRIKGVYGDVTVTKIINAMKPHERAGGHYKLRA